MKRAACLLLLALVCCGEDEPLTQIMVVVDSDYDGFTRVEIEVEGFEQPAEVTIDDIDTRSLPRRLALLHSGGPLGPIEVTVRAYVDIDGIDQQVLREPRSQLEFVRGQTRMLKVDLLWACVMEQCADACVAGGRCVTAKAAGKLVPWDSAFDRLDVEHTIESGNVVSKRDGGDALVTHDPDSAAGNDAELPGAGSGGSTGGVGSDAGKDGGLPTIDSGPPEPVLVFTYAPSNFDPGAIGASSQARPAVKLDCPTPSFDSATLTFSSWCGTKPVAGVIKQADGSDAALLVMSTLSLGAQSTLRLTGDKPVILAVYGDAQVFGVIDASARGAVPGPGGDRSCGTGEGSTGESGREDVDTSTGAGGGSGGGFGAVGGRGGAGGGEDVQVDGGTTAGNAALSPLRGGCPGGRGGAGGTAGGAGGGGGGAVQLSAAGDLLLFGSISAGGGGGMMGATERDGGGGGGSGGAILLEGAMVLIDSAAVVATNGGGGGGGQPSARVAADSTAGADGNAAVTAATGGDGSNSGGNGGIGGFGGGGPDDGEDGSIALDSAGGGGGGGGGACGAAGPDASAASSAAAARSSIVRAMLNPPGIRAAQVAGLYLSRNFFTS